MQSSSPFVLTGLNLSFDKDEDVPYVLYPAIPSSGVYFALKEFLTPKAFNLENLQSLVREKKLYFTSGHSGEIYQIIDFAFSYESDRIPPKIMFILGAEREYLSTPKTILQVDYTAVWKFGEDTFKRILDTTEPTNPISLITVDYPPDIQSIVPQLSVLIMYNSLCIIHECSPESPEEIDGVIGFDGGGLLFYSR